MSQESRALLRRNVKEKFFAAGVDTVDSFPQEFADKIKSQIAIRSKVIADSGIKVD